MGQLTSDSGSDGCLQYGVAGQKQKTSSFFNLPGLFIGSSPKGLPDCDSVRSPTSPLDFKLLSNLGSSFRSPRCSLDGHQKSWDCSKVGLGIVDSLDDGGGGKLSGKGTGSTNIKSILFAPQIKTKTPNPDSPTHFSSSEAPKSLPENGAFFPHTHFRSPYLQKGSSDLLFETGEDILEPVTFSKFRSFSLDSHSFGLLTYGLADHGSSSDSSRNSGLENAALVQEDSPSKVAGGSPPNLEETSPKKPSVAPVVVGFGNGVVGHLSPSDIELSEDYTRVVSHGPNPKTTHIYGDRILECHPGETEFRAARVGVDIGIPRPGKCAETSYPSDEFLSFCYFCKKKLEEGKDIFMYRGEKAFCSSECRLEEISIDEWKDKSVSESHGRRGQF